MENLTEKLVEAVKDCFSERGIALHVSTDDLTTAIRSVLGQEARWDSFTKEDMGTKLTDWNTWIDVEAKFPNQEVLAINQYNDYLIGYIHKIGSNYYCEGDTQTLYNVTHWQPLPTPPTT